MYKQKNNKLKFYYGSIALIGSLSLYMIIYAICGFYPMGKWSVLTWDLEGEYITFFSYLRTMLLESSTTLYSQGMSLGSNTIGLLASYAMSPLNLLLLLFEEKFLPLGIMIVILLKHGLTALTMYYFLTIRYFYGDKNASENSRYYMLYAVLSIAYSLSGYGVNMQFNLMWLDGMIILPLICAGLEASERENKKGLAIFSLWTALISNFYIGYMLWIFSFIYFCFLRLEHGIKKEWFKKALNYIDIVVSALGLGMVLLLPLLYSLSLRNSEEEEGSKIADFLKNIGWNKVVLACMGLICIVILGITIYKRKDLLKKKYAGCINKIKVWSEQHFVVGLICELGLILIVAAALLKVINVYEYKGKVLKEVLYIPLKLFVGTFDVDEIIYGLPNIYVSSMVIIMVIYYFLNEEVKLKDKLIQSSLAFIIFVSMFVKRIDYIWHGFAYPHGSRYRYSFLFSFCLILIAAKSVSYIWKDKEKDINKKYRIRLNLRIGFVLSLWLAFSLYKYSSLGKAFLSVEKILFTVGFYIAVLACFLWKKRQHKAVYFMIFFICCELCCNGVLCLKSMTYREYEDYQREAEAITEIVGMLEEKDSGIYRIEASDGGVNKGLLYGYDSISHYSSVMPIQAANLLDEFGLKVPNMDNMLVRYKADTDAEQAGLLNIKYIYSKEKLEQDKFVEILSHKGYKVYENLAWKQRGGLISEEYITDNPKDFIGISNLLEQDGVQAYENKSSELKYNISNESGEDKYLLLTIADDRGWSAKLDGKTIDIEKAYGALMSVRIPAGTHEVTFLYQVPFLKVGAIISSVFLLTILGVNILKNRKSLG